MVSYGLMLKRSPYKRKKHASEANDSNRTRISRVGRIMHCKICGGEGHNKTTCKSTDLNGGSSARSGTKTRGGSSSRPTGMGVSFNQDGQLMLRNSFGVPTPAWLHGINPSDLVQQVDVIPNFESQPQTESPP